MGMSVDAFAAKSSGIGMLGGAFTRMNLGIAGAGLALGAATKEAIDFEAAMGNVATIIDTNVESMDDLKKQVIALSKTTPIAMGDMAEGLYQIRSAGRAASEQMEILDNSNKLAIAGLGTTTESVDMITSAMNVFKKEALTSTVAADVLFKTVQGGKTKVALLAPEFGKTALAASEVGVSFRELMAMTAAVTNTGVQTAEVQTEITGALISLNKRTSEMIDIQEKLSGHVGITGAEFIEFSKTAVGAMEKVNNYATKNRLDLFKIYGRKEGALASIALTKLQNETYKKLFATMNGGETINEAVAKQSQTTAYQMKVFKNNVEALGISVGNVLLPALNSVMKIVTPLVDVFSNFITNHKELIKDVAKLGLAVLGLKAGLITYGFVTTLAVGWTGRFSGALIATESSALGAKAAITVLTAATKKFFFYISAAIAAYEWLNYISDKKTKKDDYIMRQLPKDINKRQFAEKVGINEMKYSDVGRVASDSETHALFYQKEAEYKNLMDLQEMKVQRNKQIADSTEASINDLKLQSLMKSDSSQTARSDSAFQSVGKLGMSMPQQTVKVIIDNRTPNPVSVSNNGNAAKAVTFPSVTV